MAQVIIYEGPDGNVHVCTPTDEVLASHGIEWIKAKDTPEGSIIVDDSTLPQGVNQQFFDAWEMDSVGNITVNIVKAREHQLNKYNFFALQVAQKRQLNTLSGLTNTPDDTAWLAKLTADRAAIAACNTTDELIAIELPQV